MNKLFLMIGVPGSGKSTFLKTHMNTFNDGIVISRDEIRFSKLQEGEDYFAHETEVWEDYIAAIKDALKWHKEVYLDATHLSRGSRLKVFNALGVALNDVEVNCIFFQAPLEICLDRNEMREGRKYVPRGQIRRMFYQLQKPDFEEGFTKIYTYNVKTDKMKVAVKE